MTDVMNDTNGVMTQSGSSRTRPLALRQNSRFEASRGTHCLMTLVEGQFDDLTQRPTFARPVGSLPCASFRLGSSCSSDQKLRGSARAFILVRFESAVRWHTRSETTYDWRNVGQPGW